MADEFNSAELQDMNKKVIEDFRANKGAVTVPPFDSVPIVLVHHVGAKSGTERIAPLAYSKDGDDIVIIASKGGYPQNPSWYHNLRANPDTTIELGADTISVHAEILDEGQECDRLYRQQADQMPNFDEYQQKTDRIIPVVVLHPK